MKPSKLMHSVIDLQWIYGFHGSNMINLRINRAHLAIVNLQFDPLYFFVDWFIHDTHTHFGWHSMMRPVKWNQFGLFTIWTDPFKTHTDLGGQSMIRSLNMNFIRVIWHSQCAFNSTWLVQNGLNVNQFGYFNSK